MPSQRIAAIPLPNLSADLELTAKTALHIAASSAVTSLHGRGGVTDGAAGGAGGHHLIATCSLGENVIRLWDARLLPAPPLATDECWHQAPTRPLSLFAPTTPLHWQQAQARTFGLTARARGWNSLPSLSTKATPRGLILRTISLC